MNEKGQGQSARFLQFICRKKLSYGFVIDESYNLTRAQRATLTTPTGSKNPAKGCPLVARKRSEGGGRGGYPGAKLFNPSLSRVARHTHDPNGVE